ncbi:MAG: pyridoxamine kinase [Syntrophomonadaceae bacterium]|nr:pyridoxamine kinase [Syntrophomonadaceae bacterium]MDD3888694.1 pyridoxamine kinase [Syntrophomonadaceae bacterium]MDD4548474.1 pyridoxamine kinase [Syntrophomonadaceae bacterium]
MQSPVSRVAAIHDLSGFGRASLTAIIPIISSMGIQVCPVPTAILSTHTGGFENYTFMDFTDQLEGYIEHWRSLKIKFDCIYTGFLGSPRQVDMISRCIKTFNNCNPLIVIDPVVGDNGELYDTMNMEMVEKMRYFIKLADIITPNLTEAAFLLDEPYPDTFEEKDMKEWLCRLAHMGPEIVIITSVPDPRAKKKTYSVAYDSDDGRFWKVACDYIPAHFPGTGDAFTSVIVGSMLQGDSLPIALDRAVQFVTLAIRASYGYKYPEREGILLERVLDNLKGPVTAGSYEILE